MIPVRVIQQLLIIGVAQPVQFTRLVEELSSSAFDYNTSWIQTRQEVLNTTPADWDLVIVDDGFQDIVPEEIVFRFSFSEDPIPVIYLVDENNESFGIQAMRAGARDYILKSNLSRLLPVLQRDTHPSGPLRLAAQNTEHHQTGEELIKILAELAGDFVFRVVMTPQNQFRDVWFDDAFIQYSHYRPEDLLNLTQLYDVFHPYDHPKLIYMLSDVRMGKAAKCECRLKGKNDEYHWYSVAMKPLNNPKMESGNVTILGTIADITLRKLGEFKRENLLAEMQSARQIALDDSLTLKRRAEEWEILFNTISDALMVMDGNAVIIKANQMAIEGLGLDPTGMSYDELAQKIVIMNEDRVLIQPSDWVFNRLARGEKVRQMITSIQNARGEFIWQLISGDVVKSGDRLLNVVIAWKDITSIILTNRELEEKEQTLRNVLDQSIDGVVLTDENGIIITWNAGQEAITSLQAEDVLGRPLWEVQHEFALNFDQQESLTLEELRQKLELFLITGTSPWANRVLETPIRWPNGETHYIESNIYVIPTRRGYMLGSTSRDVTERRNTEARVTEARDYYLKLLEHFPASVWLTDRKGDCNYVNQTWIDTTAQDGELDEIPIQKYWQWAIHPEDLECSLTEFVTSFQQRQPLRLHYRMRRKDGKFRWVADVGQPFTDLEGNFAGYIGACFEIHETIERQGELETMLSISAVVNSAGDIHEMIEKLLDETINLVKGENTAFALPSANPNQITIVAAKGDWQQEIGQALVPNVMPTQVFYNQIPLINFKNFSMAFKDKQPGPGEDYVIIQPLVVQNKSVGLFSVGRNAPFSPSEIRLVTGIANIAATAINRTNLHKETELYAQKMAAIGSIGRLMAETFDLQGIYHLLNYAVQDLIENVSAVAISRYYPEEKILKYQYYVNNKQTIDISTIPPIEVEPASKNYTSRVILERIPLIINCVGDNSPQSSTKPLSAESARHSALYVPLIAEGNVLGVLQAHSTAHSRFSQSDVDLMSLIANTAAIAIENAALFTNLQKANQDLIHAYDTTLEGWALALELRDQETRGHSSTTLDLTMQFCRAVGIPETELPYIRRGALLHDIGKMGIPDNILLKEGPLTDEEWVVMRRHPVYAFDLLNKIDFLDRSLDIPYCHHEHWDGSGYPRGLKGEEIPLTARIFAIVDVWNALQRDRPYRPAWPREKTIAYIQSQSGIQFDPQLIEIFMGMLDSIE